MRRKLIFVVVDVKHQCGEDLLLIADAFDLLGLPPALFNAGSSIEARMAMIAITTSNSISVNKLLFIFPFLPFVFLFVVFFLNPYEHLSIADPCLKRLPAVVKQDSF